MALLEQDEGGPEGDVISPMPTYLHETRLIPVAISQAMALEEAGEAVEVGYHPWL